jgi:hypothetical protein
MQLSIRDLTCPLCRGRGIVRPSHLCPRCEGAGRVQRLRLACPVIDAGAAQPFDGRWWSTLVVTASEHAANRLLVTGVTESGHPLTTFLRPDAIARTRLVTFDETEAGS